MELVSGEGEEWVREVEKGRGMKNLLGVMKWVVEKEGMWMKEEMKGRYKGGREVGVGVREGLEKEDEVEIEFDLVGGGGKEEGIVMK